MILLYSVYQLSQNIGWFFYCFSFYLLFPFLICISICFIFVINYIGEHKKWFLWKETVPIRQVISRISTKYKEPPLTEASVFKSEGRQLTIRYKKLNLQYKENSGGDHKDKREVLGSPWEYLMLITKPFRTSIFKLAPYIHLSLGKGCYSSFS